MCHLVYFILPLVLNQWESLEQVINLNHSPQQLNHLLSVWAGKRVSTMFFEMFFINTKQILIFVKVSKNCEIQSPKLWIFYSFRPTNNIGCYHYADKTVILAFCKYMKNKTKNKRKKKWTSTTSSHLPTDDCFSGTLIVDSALLLYFSESRTRSQNSSIVHIFQNLLLFMSVFDCVSQNYFWLLWQW